MTKDPFNLILPRNPEVPILISVPHAGTDFTDSYLNQLKKEHIQWPDDTDWHVHRLYDFAPDMGIGMIVATYSRWVIDLNRNLDNLALYNDGRRLTGLFPETDFQGNPIYRSSSQSPDEEEKNKRIQTIYQPYYEYIETYLSQLRDKFGFAILWDGHSIRSFVPEIRKTRFPDLVLGTNDGQSASQDFIGVVRSHLKDGPYEMAYNHPFKGGNITRTFGDPENNIHAFQLEMNKVLYMDDAEKNYHPERAQKVKNLLRNVLSRLIDATK